MGPLLRPRPAIGRRADRPGHGRLLLRHCLLRDRPGGTARICGGDDEVTMANFSGLAAGWVPALDSASRRARIIRAVPADESPRATCVFCQIVDGREPASVVYFDAGVVAFMDLRPINAGHLLVVPRAHAARLADLDERLGAAMFAVGQRLAGAIRRSGLPCEGVNLFVPDGAVAGQEVMHIHLHVLPRTPGDGFRIERGSAITGRAELDQAAALVRGGLDRAD